MEREKTGEAVEAFRRYAQAFQTLDPKAVVPHFHEPALLIAPQGTFALPTGAAVEQAYRGVMAELPAMGYARTDFSQLSETRLSDDLAVVSGVGAWKKASGEELSRFGMTYTCAEPGRLGASSWRPSMTPSTGDSYCQDGGYGRRLWWPSHSHPALIPDRHRLPRWRHSG